MKGILLFIMMLSGLSLSAQKGEEEVAGEKWKHEFSVFYTAGHTDWDDLILGMGINYQVFRSISNRFSVFAGTGIENFNIEAGEMVFPVYGGGHFRFLQKKTSPFVSMAAGYGFASGLFTDGLKGEKGGIMLHPKVGYQFSVGYGILLNVATGFRYQKASYETDYYYYYERFIREYSYRRFTLHTGIMF